MQQVPLAKSEAQKDRDRSRRNTLWIVGLCLLPALMSLPEMVMSSLGFVDQRKVEREATAAAEQEQLRRNLQDYADLITGPIYDDAAKGGMEVKCTATDTSHLDVKVDLPRLVTELEAKEIALLVQQRYAAEAPNGIYLAVTVRSPAGQQLAHVFDRVSR